MDMDPLAFKSDGVQLPPEKEGIESEVAHTDQKMTTKAIDQFASFPLVEGSVSDLEHNYDWTCLKQSFQDLIKKLKENQ